MGLRVAIGIAALTAATSCVAPIGPVALDRGTPAPAPAHGATRPAAVLPAGPQPTLLADQPAAPAATDRVPAAAPPFLAATRPDAAARALDCLTAAVYYEARSQALDGQEAVAQVVLNRVRNPAFPNSVCGTVYEGSSRETGCQFTFTCDGSMAARIEPEAWQRARRVAQAALDGFVYAPVGSATYYHTNAVSPWWAPRLTEVARIGAHIFYRMPGQWGSSLAFEQRYSGTEPRAAAGTQFREKSAVQAVAAAVEAGVTIHRGGDEEDRAPAVAVSSAFGVQVHRGVTPGGNSQAGVRVHRFEAPDATPAARES